MAFSKAKLLRFNDISSCAPAPGAYNPKYDEHVPGIKYVEPQSPGSSVSDNKSVTSNISISNFRTPVVPRRKTIVRSNSTGKSSKQCASPQKSEALREKIVECLNKDDTIKDLESQLEDLKLALSNLQVQKNHLMLERDEIAQNFQEVQTQLDNTSKQLVQKDLDNKATENEFNEMKALLKAENAAQMYQLQENLDLLQTSLKEHDVVVKETEQRCENLQKMYDELQILNNELNEKYEESLQIQNNLKIAHSNEIKSLITLHENEMESEIRKIVEHWKEIIQQIEKQNEEKIKNIEEEQKLEFDKHKNEIKEKSDLEENISSLKTNMEKLNSELEETKNKLKTEINEHEKSKAAAVADKHCYEVTLNKTYETVNALKNRLIHSDKDVEQLTKELNTLEKAKLNMVEKYTKEIEQHKKFFEEFKSKSFIIIQDKIEYLQSDLLNKIDDFKSKANSEITRLTAVIEKQTKELKKLHEYIQEQRSLHTKAYSLVAESRSAFEKMETEANEYKARISKMQDDLEEKQKIIEEIEEAKDKQVNELKDKIKERDTEMNELASIYKKYIEKSRHYDELQQKHEELENKCKRLEKKIAEQDSLIGPFREQLQNYEQECQILLLHKGEAEKEAKEMGMKYAEILGHQNIKQKIKHMINLKKKNIELMECKQNYETKIIQQNRTIEKLKRKLAQMSKPVALDKENIASPGRISNLYNSPGALKERN